MSEAKFTHGPWLIKPAETVKRVINRQEYDVTTRIAILDSTGRAYRPRHTVAQITMGNPCHLANAHLIAVAPKMYGELEKIAQFLRVAHRDLTKLYGRRAISEAMEYEAGKIDELLAEARGEVQE